jgi:hypothetical protein
MMPFVGYPRQNMPKRLAIRLEDYLSLVDWTGRQLCEDKRGAISEAQPAILHRLGISCVFCHEFSALLGWDIAVILHKLSLIGGMLWLFSLYLYRQISGIL